MILAARDVRSMDLRKLYKARGGNAHGVMTLLGVQEISMQYGEGLVGEGLPVQYTIFVPSVGETVDRCVNALER